MKKIMKLIAYLLAIVLIINTSATYATALPNMEGDSAEFGEYSATLKEVSLSIGGEIAINFYLDLSEMVSGKEWKYKVNGEEDKVGASLQTADDGSTYLSCYVNAKDMSEKIYLTLFDENGKVVKLKDNSENDSDNEYPNGTFEYSVKEYYEDVLNNDSVSDTTKRMISAMDAYGQMLQLYLNYEVDSVPNDKIVESLDLSAINKYKRVEPSGTLPEGLEYVGASVNFAEELSIRHYFTLAEGYSISDYAFFEDYGDDTLQEYTPVSKNGKYYVELKDVPIAEIAQIRKLEVSPASPDGTYTSTWNIEYGVMHYVYDVLSYGNADQKLLDLCKALYSFYKASTECFEVVDSANTTEFIQRDSLISYLPEPYEGDLGAKAYELVDRGAAFNMYSINDARSWYSFQLAALKEMQEGNEVLHCKDYGVYGNAENNKHIVVYNTTGTANGIFIYYGEFYKDNQYRGKTTKDGDVVSFDKGEGKWARTKLSEKEDSFVYTYEMYDGKWYMDNPYDGYVYDFVELTVNKENSSDTQTIETKYNGTMTMSNGISTNGLIQSDVTVDRIYEDPDYYIVHHKYKLNFNREGRIQGSVDENGLVRHQCISEYPGDLCNHTDSNDYITVNPADTFKVNGVTGYLSDLFYPCDDNLKLSNEKEYINRAYEIIKSDKIDYDGWSALARDVRDKGLVYERYIFGQVKNEKNSYIAIYSGYGKNDNEYDNDIYIYYGQGKIEGGEFTRQGTGKWICVTSHKVTEPDTQYEDFTGQYEISTVNWENDKPVGNFEKDTYSEIYTSTKSVKLHHHYSGSLDSEARFNGTVNWSRESNIESVVYDYDQNKLVLGEPIGNTYNFSAYFSNGTLMSDGIDGEGYTYIDSNEAGSSEQERMTVRRVYELGGFKRQTFTSAEEVFRAYTDNSSLVDSDLTEGNDKYTELRGNDTAKQYANSLLDDAMVVATENEESWDTWNRLKKNAKVAGIVDEQPLIAKLADGNYIGIYCSDDNRTYFVYYGAMDENFLRSGQGTWLTGLDYFTTKSEGDTVSGRYIQKYSGNWSADKPEGDFSEVNTTWISKSSGDMKIVRSYSGRVAAGAFDGIINWNVKSETSKDGEVKSNTSHAYSARFRQGIIQGYNADRYGYVSVPELYSGITEDRIHLYTQYGYAGLGYETIISGDSIKYK